LALWDFRVFTEASEEQDAYDKAQQLNTVAEDCAEKLLIGRVAEHVAVHKLPSALVRLHSLLLLALGCNVSGFRNFQHLRFQAQGLVAAHHGRVGKQGEEMGIGRNMTISKEVILEHAHEDGGEEAGEEQDSDDRVEDREPEIRG
jgi:hypothetical protein